MRIVNIGIVALAAFGAEAPAFAGDYHPYVGALVGFDRVNISDPYGSGGQSGVVYGGVAGLDYTLHGTGLVGVEVEGNGSSTSQTAVFGPGQYGTLSAGRDVYFGARAGMVVAPHVLAYVKGGYTNAKVNLSYTSGGTTSSYSTDLNGWRIGAGTELAMRRVRWRLEYRYSDYGQYSYFGIPTGVDTKRHQVVMGALLDF